MKIELRISPDDLNGIAEAVRSVEDVVLKHCCIDRRGLKITMELTSFEEEREEIVASHPGAD